MVLHAALVSVSLYGIELMTWHHQDNVLDGKHQPTFISLFSHACATTVCCV